ncbi:Hypothetical protein CAP_5619 [Chondromyces apiculatus DSM 436]|uniref:Uncharacterized protein n=2 Tax=Chondromyces apiculatus TaxID=51 RepID=A0A017T4B9_9BACT|nr:Hypothetical protein CAP_5619 [Chondromyces apiculatus DSM 436]
MSLLLLLGCGVCGACGPADKAEPEVLAQSVRMLAKSIAAVDDSRAVKAGQAGVGEDPAVVAAVAELRLVIQQAERTTARLAVRAPVTMPAQLDALRGSAEQLRQALARGQEAELRSTAEAVETHAKQVSGVLRGLVDEVRPWLQRITPDASVLAGQLPTSGGTLVVRVIAGLYTAATIVGLWAAMIARDALARQRRRLNGVVFVGLSAFGIAAMTIGASPIAARMAPELSIPDGEERCAAALARGSELDRALRIAVERASRQESPPPAKDARVAVSTGARGPSRRELLAAVRGGSERGLLSSKAAAGALHAAQAVKAAQMVTAPGQQAARPPDGAEVLAREVRELSAECVAFTVAGEALDEARYYHALAAEYLGRPLTQAGTPRETPGG